MGCAVQRSLLALDADRPLRRQQDGVLRTYYFRLGILDRLAGLARHARRDPPARSTSRAAASRSSAARSYPGMAAALGYYPQDLADAGNMKTHLSL